LVACRNVPHGNRCKQAVCAIPLVLATLGCGGGKSPDVKLVQGTGYTFRAPASWEIVRTARQVQAAEGKRSLALVSVSRLPLLRTFRPELWAKVVPELDRVADGLARQQRGSIIDSRSTKIAGEDARRYRIAYDLRGKKLVEEVAFVLRGKTEFLLLCRYEQTASHAACDGLMSSFLLR
jgi:hypothetical protein